MSHKVILIGPVWPYRGGISHHTAVLSEMLSQSGFEVKVISFRRQYPGWLYPGQTDKDNSQEPLRFDAKFILDPFDIVSWWKTAQEIRKESPEIVAVQWWTTFWSLPLGILTRYLSLMKTNITFLIHNVIPHERRIWDKWLAKFALSGSKYFIVHSELERVRLLEILPESNIWISSLPVYTVSKDEMIPKREARRQLGVNENQPLLLFFGFVRPYKGLSVLLEALANLKLKGVKVNLLIAGEFWQDKKAYLNRIVELNLSDRIKIIDRYIPNEEVPLIFSAADVLVAPYLQNATQSAVASLALGYGTPVIMSKIIAQGLTNQYRERVIVVNTGDVGGLEVELEYFISRKEIRKFTKIEQSKNFTIVDSIIQIQETIAKKKEL